LNFNTFNYILLFLPLAFGVCQLARRLPIPKAPQVCLLLASLVFYAWGDPSNLPYLLASALVNWQVARLIGEALGLRRKRYLQLGLVLNLSFLCAFKYVNFFISNIPYFVHRNMWAPNVAAPLGISFFTVTQIMYLVDCYEDLTHPSSLFDHLTFVSFFPYVISGPISRARRVIHQFPELNGRIGPSSDVYARAIFLFSLGLVKKAVLGDAFSIAVDYGFSNISNLSMIEAWWYVTAYALQVYFDFSGYSDMAIASALFFGIEIPRNFDAPLRSTSIIEYWQRWHITLTSFITTYIYTPLIRSFGKATLLTSAIATMITMVITGLWHGANWTFVIVGVIHGVALSVNQYWRKTKKPKLPRLLSWALTFLVYETAFVFFRSPDLAHAELYLSRLVNWHHALSTTSFSELYTVNLMARIFLLAQLVGIVAAFFGKSTDQLALNFKPTWITYAAAVACALIAFLYLNSNVARPFVYFKF
jgi:alginate O-acetyltransferase complex protein AlgI